MKESEEQEEEEEALINNKILSWTIRITLYPILFLIIFFYMIWIFTSIISPHHYIGLAVAADCKANLHEIDTYLDWYYDQNNTYISHEDIEHSEYDNWVRFILAKMYESPESDRSAVRQLLVCPFSERNEESSNNNYWWADLSNEECFPKNQLGPSVKPKTPIAGDGPDYHGDLPPLVLLKNGVIKEAERGSKLWELAYGGGGGNCLKPPSSD